MQSGTSWTVTSVAGVVLAVVALAPEYLDLSPQIAQWCNYIVAVGTLLGWYTHPGRVALSPAAALRQVVPSSQQKG